MTAVDRLAMALVDVEQQGKLVPCRGRHADRWTSDASDRQWAAFICKAMGCPLLSLCGEAGDEVKATAGVWGGVPRGNAGRATAPRGRGGISAERSIS